MCILTGWLEDEVPQQYRSSPKGIIIFFSMLGINLKFSLDCIKDKIFLDLLLKVDLKPLFSPSLVSFHSE